jgi:hypothetical protein
MILVQRESAAHWYFPDGTPHHEVARADGKGARPTNLRDARKLGLFPSVTNILAVLAKPGLDAWKQEQAILAALTLPRRQDEPLDDFARRVVADMTQQVRDAADLGSAIHTAIENYAQSGDIPENPEVLKLFEPARVWFDAEVDDVHAVEAAVAHPEWGYAGRVDLVATLRSTGRPTVIDFKTQKARTDKKGSFQPIFYETWELQLEAYRQALASRSPEFATAETASVVIGSTEPVPVSMKVWEPLDAPSRFRAFLAARQLWVWTKGYCPVVDGPPAHPDDAPPAAAMAVAA